ncbi:hypothetical protein llap_7658 [Limosa lapponica baueri]|uniref:Uncharacterized protein n=1 Tax=Limosa lapponica baueri TaxID=1758121 RepID=A0A2I0U7J4_LIMLA|nr:hypothetical protein llap_7658 [Limosa lapponica baueri]
MYVSRLGNHYVFNAPDYATELGDRTGYAKQGKVYGVRRFCWESRQESRSFCKLLALCWYATDTDWCLEAKADLPRLQRVLAVAVVPCADSRRKVEMPCITQLSS